MTGGGDGQFDEQLAAHARQELEQVRQLLVESEELLQQALRLPVSSEHVKGILTRQGAQVHVNVQIKSRKEGSIQFQHSMPQMSIILDSLFRTDRLFSTLKQADLAALLVAGQQAIKTLSQAQFSLEAPTEETVFPTKVRPIQPGLGGEAYISNSELICIVYTYQDSTSGHQALSQYKVSIGDPGLLAFTAKLDAGLHRVEHVVHSVQQYLE